MALPGLELCVVNLERSASFALPPPHYVGIEGMNQYTQLQCLTSLELVILVPPPDCWDDVNAITPEQCRARD